MRRFTIIDSLIIDSTKIGPLALYPEDYIYVDLADFLNIPNGAEVEAEDPISAFVRFLDLFPPPAYGGGEEAARMALARGLFHRPGPAFPCQIRIEQMGKDRRAILVAPTCPVCARRYKTEGEIELVICEEPGCRFDQRLWSNRVMAIWSLHFPSHALTARHIAAVYDIPLSRARRLVKEFRAMRDLIGVEGD